MAEQNASCVAIVQARLGSSRLPLKSLLCLRDLPVIDWVVSRLAKATLIDKIIVAIPDTPLDQVLYEHLTRRGVNCIMGEENDVLARFVRAAKSTDCSLIVRVCADNPLISGEVVDRLVAYFRKTPCDYAYNHIPRNNLWPDGLGAEILQRELLEELHSKATERSQREHCLNYIWDHADHFRIATFDPEEPWLRRPDIKLDIDRPEDFQRLALLPFSPEMDCQAIIRTVDAAARHD